MANKVAPEVATPISWHRVVGSSKRSYGVSKFNGRRDNKIILGFDHILLDISAQVDDDFIERYKVLIGEGIMANEIHVNMYEELKGLPTVEYIPGSTMVNTIRIAQWILGGKSAGGTTAILGAIGDDESGSLLKLRCNQEGVTTCLMTVPSARTGVCGVCLKGVERGLVTRFNAANEYKLEHLQANERLFDSAGIIYTTGFFLGCCNGDIAIYAAERAKKIDALFCMNLAACYIPKKYPDTLERLITLSDYVFGNDKEATAYAESVGLECTSVEKVASYLANIPSEKGMRTVVITQGTNFTILARSDGVFLRVPVLPVLEERIVDVNAAGDSFVGGFLAALYTGENPWACVQTGLRAASYIIQRSGCSFEGDFWNISDIDKDVQEKEDNKLSP